MNAQAFANVEPGVRSLGERRSRFRKSIKPLFNTRDKENYIHQIDFFSEDGGADQRPRLLMIHGYGCCGCTFYGMIKYLKKYFRITTVDMLGQGASGRPDFSIKKSAADCIDYFLLSIEAWMRTTKYRRGGKESEYILLGHSLGGYIGA